MYTHTMGDKWEASYSAMTILEAEKRLGIQIDELKTVHFKKMLSKWRMASRRRCMLILSNILILKDI